MMIGKWLSTLVPEPGARRRLGVGTGIYNIGTGMFMTSSVLYFTEGLGLSITEVGLWLAVAGLIGLFAGVPMGHLADRRGPRGVAALSLVVLAVTMVGYIFITSIWMFVVVTVVEMLATAASRASRGGLIRRVGGEGAAAYRSQLRAIENAGVGIGAAVGGLALTLHTLAAYQVLFVANAVTFLIGAWVCAKLPHLAPLSAPPGTRPGVALRDKPFIVYTILNGVMSLQYAVITFALPLWIATETNAPRWMVGAVLLVNTVGVVVLQVWVGRKVNTVRQGAAAMRIAGLVFLVACGGVAVAANLPTWAAAAVLLAAVAVHSVGEMCHAAAVFALSFELAPAHAQSEYVGLQDMGLGAAFAVAPAVLGAMCLGIGQVGWLLLGGMLTAAGLATVPVVRWAVRTRPSPSRRTWRQSPTPNRPPWYWPPPGSRSAHRPAESCPRRRFRSKDDPNTLCSTIIRDSPWIGIAWWDGILTTATPFGVACVPSRSTSAPTGCPEPIWRSVASSARCTSSTASRETVSPSGRPDGCDGRRLPRGSRSLGYQGCPSGSAAESCGWKQPVTTTRSPRHPRVRRPFA